MLTTTHRSILISILATCLIFSASSVSAAPGDLDPTFGVGGKVLDGLAYESYDVAIQPDGKIVAAGISLGGSEGTQIAIVRYNIDGSPDTTFGVMGRVFIDRYGVGIDIAIQPDGKIVAASRNNDGKVFGELLRLNSDGSLDTSFGTNGFLEAFFLPSVAAIQPDGKVLIHQGARLFRLNPDGSFDITFAPCEPSVPSLHYPNNRTESIIQPDGRILTAFTRPIPPFPATESRFGVFRCNADGTLDTGFGSGGVVATAVSSGLDVAQSIAMQADAKIVITGRSPGGHTVVRYNPNGSLDSGFGVGGIVTTPLGSASGLNDVAIQTDGKILATSTNSNGSNRDFALIRYNPNGSLDTTFGGGDGIATVDFDNSNDDAYGIALDSNGRAVVVGTSTGFALARFLLDSAATAVSVSGRVTKPGGQGLANAVVSMTDSLGVTRTATASTFGYYSFENIPVGGTYTLYVSSRRYRFLPRTLIIEENLTDIDFTGQE